MKILLEIYRKMIKIMMCQWKKISFHRCLRKIRSLKMKLQMRDQRTKPRYIERAVEGLSLALERRKDWKTKNHKVCNRTQGTYRVSLLYLECSKGRGWFMMDIHNRKYKRQICLTSLELTLESKCRGMDKERGRKRRRRDHLMSLMSHFILLNRKSL